MAAKALFDGFTLSNGLRMPRLGFGVWRSPVNLCAGSCLKALGYGYRHIDTAQLYGNEREVGLAVQKSSVPREDVFLTTKIMLAGGSVGRSYGKCLDSVRKIDPAQGYVDLFLIHNPRGGPAQRKEMWLALERLYEEGKARSIGVSNYGIKHIDEMRAYAKVWPPHVNQIELHPWMQQREIVEHCRERDIVIQAYCPLVRNRKADDKTLRRIARKHEVNTSQVLIRYSIQKGWAPLPKSDKPERIKAYAEVYGFSLDEDDMDALDALDEGPAGAIIQAVEN